MRGWMDRSLMKSKKHQRSCRSPFWTSGWGGRGWLLYPRNGLVYSMTPCHSMVIQVWEWQPCWAHTDLSPVEHTHSRYPRYYSKQTLHLHQQSKNSTQTAVALHSIRNKDIDHHRYNTQHDTTIALLTTPPGGKKQHHISFSSRVSECLRLSQASGPALGWVSHLFPILAATWHPRRHPDAQRTLQRGTNRLAQKLRCFFNGHFGYLPETQGVCTGILLGSWNSLWFLAVFFRGRGQTCSLGNTEKNDAKCSWQLIHPCGLVGEVLHDR